MPDLIRHPPQSSLRGASRGGKPGACRARCCDEAIQRNKETGLLRCARNDGYFFSTGTGATHGLNAPPGTAEATGLSKPSLLTDETPNTQSSTRMLSKPPGKGRLFLLFRRLLPKVPSANAPAVRLGLQVRIRRATRGLCGRPERNSSNRLPCSRPLGLGGGGAVPMPPVPRVQLATFRDRKIHLPWCAVGLPFGQHSGAAVVISTATQPQRGKPAFKNSVGFAAAAKTVVAPIGMKSRPSPAGRPAYRVTRDIREASVSQPVRDFGGQSLRPCKRTSEKPAHLVVHTPAAPHCCRCIVVQLATRPA